MFKKIMLVSWGLPPEVAGSAIVVGNLAKQFPAEDLTLVGELRYGKSQVEPLPSDHARHYVLRQPKWAKRFFRTIKWCWLPIVVWRMLRLVKQKQPRVIVAVFPDEFFLSASYLVSRIRRLPFFPYMHNSYADNRTGLRGFIARRLEPLMFRHAKSIFVMSDGLKQHYENKYPQFRFVSLIHSFNDPLPPIRQNSSCNTPARLICLGAINSTNLDAIQRFVEAVRDRKDLRLTFVSGQPKSTLDRFGLTGTNIDKQFAETDELLPLLNSSDILFLPHGLTGSKSDVEYISIFPTRTLSYLIAGKPILAHSPSGVFLSEWLLENECAEVVTEPSRELLAESIELLMTDNSRRSQLIVNARRISQQFHAGCVARVMVDSINDSIESNVKAETQ